MTVKKWVKGLEPNPLKTEATASILSLILPAISRVSVTFQPVLLDRHILNSSKYDLKECKRVTRGTKHSKGTRMPDCPDVNVASEMDEAFKLWDDYWPLQRGCTRHVKRVENYPPGTDPNSNGKL